jgi:hypothetical protein
MSTKLQDFPSATAVVAGFYPGVQSSSVDGPAVDLGTGDGPCFAVQMVGNVAAGTTLAGHVEQSDDQTTWTAISGATFTTVTTSNHVEAIQFTPTARYVRWSAALIGADPSAAVAALIGRQKKTI